MAGVSSRYNARSDWLSAASRQGIILPQCPRADYGLCKLGKDKTRKVNILRTKKEVPSANYEQVNWSGRN